MLSAGSRFDGRTIRVDKASDNGPRGGYPPRGGGVVGGFGMRGGYGGMQNPGMPQMAYGHPQQGYPMAAHPQMYAAQQQQYGRGGYPPQAAAMNYGAMPQQGKSVLPNGLTALPFGGEDCQRKAAYPTELLTCRLAQPGLRVDMSTDRTSSNSSNFPRDRCPSSRCQGSSKHLRVAPLGTRGVMVAPKLSGWVLIFGA
jgi:hypothetical protein